MSENKIQFIENELTALCKAINNDITELRYDNVGGEEYILVNYTYTTQVICISADSLKAIVIDTLKKVS